MIEVPLYLLKNPKRKLPKVSNGHSRRKYSSLDKLIVSKLPERRLRSLAEPKSSRLRATFGILRDLSVHGWQGQLYKDGTRNAVVSLKAPDAPLSKQQIRDTMEPRRLELIQQSADWIRRVEPAVMQHLADGNQVLPLQINPELEECQDQEQQDIFRYCRFLSSVPYSEYVGRRMHFLIRDGAFPFSFTADNWYCSTGK